MFLFLLLISFSYKWFFFQGYAKGTMKYKNGLSLLLVATCLLMLSACHQHARKVRNYGLIKNIDTTIGLNQRTGVTDTKVTQLENELKSKGVSIVSVGQDYRIIIPAELVYYYQSPRIQMESYDIVNLIVDYIKQFRTVSMRVDAYSQDKDKNRAGALSLARARAMVDYLWSQAIDTRILYTQAHAMNRSPTACCESPSGRGDVPTRVEITFRNAII